MALKSERHETVVNPDNGIYVEMEQIMEVGFDSAETLSIVPLLTDTEPINTISIRCASPVMIRTSIVLQKTSRFFRRESGLMFYIKIGRMALI